MANTSRKKTLPLAVLAAPALAFGSLTFAAAPAMAVPVEDVEQVETVRPEISLNVTEAQIGDTVRITLDNLDDVIAVHDPNDYEVNVSGDVRTGDSFGGFGDLGIEPVGTEPAYEFIIPDSIATDSDVIVVGPESTFTFQVTIVMDFDDETQLDTYSDLEIVTVLENEIPEEEDEDNETSNEDETPGGEEAPGDNEDSNEDGTPGDEEGTPESYDPVLSVESDEILVEDFVGDPEEGAGITHSLTGMAPDTEFEYAVETPANIQPFSSSVLSDENGAAEFSIYGENADNPSVYLGDYTTTVAYVDEDEETQELTASFSVVEASNDNGDVGGGEDEEVTPVVDTEEPTEPVADTDNDQDEAAPAPAVGGADAQLADTGANGTSLMWIAGGLLALGGAFVIYANRGRLFGRKN